MLLAKFWICNFCSKSSSSITDAMSWQARSRSGQHEEQSSDINRQSAPRICAIHILINKLEAANAPASKGDVQFCMCHPMCAATAFKDMVSNRDSKFTTPGVFCGATALLACKEPKPAHVNHLDLCCTNCPLIDSAIITLKPRASSYLRLVLNIRPLQS